MARKRIEKFDCCGEGHCECKKMKEEQIKVYMCPKCKSHDVGFVFTFKNLFGMIPKMRCRKCGFESPIFPILEVNKEKIKIRKKTKSARKKK